MRGETESSPERVSCERSDTETNQDSALSAIHRVTK